MCHRLTGYGCASQSDQEIETQSFKERRLLERIAAAGCEVVGAYIGRWGVITLDQWRGGGRGSDREESDDGFELHFG